MLDELDAFTTSVVAGARKKLFGALDELVCDSTLVVIAPVVVVVVKKLPLKVVVSVVVSPFCVVLVACLIASKVVDDAVWVEVVLVWITPEIVVSLARVVVVVVSDSNKLLVVASVKFLKVDVVVVVVSDDGKSLV
ncbi:MAG: hypothetical protein KGP13_03335 [Burkholderiales bacterium]|nr:hypothetical protein [Burkholderiales bacterium]